MPHSMMIPTKITWRIALLALVLGVISAAGFQPLGLWLLAMAAMGLFALLIPSCRSWKQALWLGWLFGMGHFTFGDNWIATAFTYQAKMPAILGWAAVPLLSVYLAVFPALAAFGTWLLAKDRRGPVLWLAFAGWWIVTEWLRSWVFTGFAWNPFGVVLLGPFKHPGIALLAPWLGTYALSGLAVLLSVGLVSLVLRRRFVAAGLVVVLLFAGMYWPVGPGRTGTLHATIVQPDIDQEHLENPRYYEANFMRLANLSRPHHPGETRLVLWPESGLADYLQDGYPQIYYDSTTALGSPDFARARIGQVIGPGSELMTGAVDLKFDHGKLAGAYNAVTALNSSGDIIGSYYKAHLVPYGEYLPMRWLLQPLGLSRLVPGSIDFLPGPGPRTLDLGAQGKAGVQICYEIVFSGQNVDRHDRPDYIFNPSNDGWFGAFGPPQHLAQARLRAIEEGLPILRSTVTGISAVIDARGVVRAFLPLHTEGRIDTIVPPAKPPTLFARLGNILPLAWALVLLAAALVARGRTAR